MLSVSMIFQYNSVVNLALIYKGSSYRVMLLVDSADIVVCKDISNEQTFPFLQIASTF